MAVAMALGQKITSLIKGFLDPVIVKEAELLAKNQERADIIALPGDPAPLLEAFRMQVTAAHDRLAVRAGDIVRRAGDISTVFSNDPALLFLLPHVVKQFEDAFLTTYPTTWITEEKRRERIKKVDEERIAISRQLTKLYADLEEADVDYVPIPDIDPGIFLGVEE